MDPYSLLDGAAASAPGRAPEKTSVSTKPVKPPSSTPLRFPQGPGESLIEMAERDLEAALQLLAERAQYITGSSGAAIAVRERGAMICRASVGASAPALGAELQTDSGLTGECVRTGEILRSDDAESDSRVNRDSCRALGICSVMVVPLLRDGQAIGVFELLADRSSAFEERDVIALRRLAEMALTALDHANAATHVFEEIKAANDAESPFIQTREAVSAQEPESVKLVAATTQPAVQEEAAEAKSEPIAAPSQLDHVEKCQSCGFPVSKGRKLCLDCEEIVSSGGQLVQRNEAPTFLSELAAQGSQRSWLRRHGYTIGTVVVAVLTIVLIVLKLR